MKCIRVAIIGFGRSGWKIHAEYLKTEPRRFRVVAVVDPLASRRRMAEADLGCRSYASHDELLANHDIDLIVNAAPSRFHVPITLDFLQAGFDVLCEKPLASCTRDVDRLIEAARRSGKTLAVFQQARFAPYFEQVRKVIDSGVLGRVVQISISYGGFSRRYDWQTLIEEMGGALMNTGAHPLDQALSLIGGEGIPRVTCQMRRTVTLGNAEDHVRLVLSMEKAPLVEIEISACCGFPDPMYRVLGTRGGLTATPSTMEWRYYRPEEAPRRRLCVRPLSRRDGTPADCHDELRWHVRRWRLPKRLWDFDYMSFRFYRMLYSSLTRGTPLEITPEQIRRQIAIFEECRRQNPAIYQDGHARSSALRAQIPDGRTREDSAARAVRCCSNRTE